MPAKTNRRISLCASCSIGRALNIPIDELREAIRY